MIEYQTDTIVGGQEPMLASLESLEGLRAWRDFLVEHQRRLHCRGGCPIGSLGSELAEIDQQARADVAASFARWEAGQRDTRPLEISLDALLTLIAASQRGG